MNILLTSIGGKTNLIKYFQRALINEGGGEVHVMDSDGKAVGRFFADKFYQSPATQATHFYQWLLNKVEQEGIDLIVPTRDGDMCPLSSIQTELASRFDCQVMLPSAASLEICINKRAFAEWCRENGFESLPELDLGSLSKQDFPVFIKPRIGSGSQRSFKVEHWERWMKVRESVLPSDLIQPFFALPEYTVDIYIDGNEQVVSVVPRKRLKVSHGESVHGVVDCDSTIISEVSRLAKKLQLVGHNTIQCFRSKDSVIMIEVNPRFGGGFTLGIEAGADTPRYLVQERRGLPVSPPKTLVEGLQMVRIEKDIFFGGDSSEKVWCFDLDGTICTESCAYEDAKPVVRVVNRINDLYQKGHTIIIATARGAASGKDWRELIESQLKVWGVMYHRLVTTKPYADYYIDNKSVDVLEYL